MRRTLAAVRVAEALLDGPDAQRWGYELAQLTGLAPGVLYPILVRMEKQGWLISAWEPPGEGGPPRRLYRITDTGRTALVEFAGRTRR